MARVTDTVTGKRRQARTDVERLAAQAAAALKDAGAVVVASQGTLNFCATCGHSKTSEHPNGPCIARWYVGEEKSERICNCREYWPERKQREEGYAVTGWNLKFGGSVPILHKRRAETELWDGFKTGGAVKLLIVAVAGPRGFKGVKDHGVILSVEENRPLLVESIVIVDGETGELE